MNRPELLISVIIPTLNEEDRITILLDQLVTWPGVEIIVCDGGSSDNTVELCRDYPVQVIDCPAGRGMQLNAGAECAQGEILLFLHADSIPERRVVDDVRQAFAQGHMWGCCRLRFNESTWIFNSIAFFSDLRSGIFSVCFGDQGIYCSRAIFEQIGGFPESLFLEDMGISRRLRRHQRAWMIPGTITTSSRRYREHGVWKTIGKIQLIKLGFAAGIKPEQLSRWWNRSNRQEAK